MHYRLVFSIWIIDCSASSIRKGLLCFIRKGQQPLVIVPGLYVYSSVMPWHLCRVCSQANRRRQHQPGRRPQVSRADFVPTWALIPKDWHGTRILRYTLAHCSWCHGGWDRRLAYQIFICLLCSVQILWTGKMHYVWISARAASDKEIRLFGQ